jgi:hypothetical protein
VEVAGRLLRLDVKLRGTEGLSLLLLKLRGIKHLHETVRLDVRV